MCECVCVCTNTGAAHEDNQEGLHDSGHADDPRQSQEKDDAKDVLEARQVDPHQCAHVGRLREDKTARDGQGGVSGNRDRCVTNSERDISGSKCIDHSH